MAQTREQRLRQMAEINRRRLMTDPEYRERKRVYMRDYHRNRNNPDGNGNDGRVRLPDDEGMWWHRLLRGQHYEDHPAAVAPEPPLRMLPAASLTAHSSMAWSA